MVNSNSDKKVLDDSVDMDVYLKKNKSTISNNTVSTNKSITNNNTVSSNKKSPAKTVTKNNSDNQRKNESPYEYLSMPDTNKLKPKGHSKADYSIRWINKKKDCIELTSQAGMLRVMPIASDIIRVTFHKGQLAGFEQGYFDRKVMDGAKFKVRENKDVVEITTASLKVVVEKRTGAVQFFSSDGKLLLSEKKTEPRQMEDNQNWTYFDWEKSEKLKSRGILRTDVKDITAKARYISHGGKNLRMPFIISGKGYGIAVAAEDTVLCCNISTYGNYIYCEKSKQSDYYFLFGGNNEKTMDLYDLVKSDLIC